MLMVLGMNLLASGVDKTPANPTVQEVPRVGGAPKHIKY
jgi:hypothetical protein